MAAAEVAAVAVAAVVTLLEGLVRPLIQNMLSSPRQRALPFGGGLVFLSDWASNVCRLGHRRRRRRRQRRRYDDFILK